MTTNDETQEWDERTFLSLSRLIEIKVRISTLATAIERHGIQGWDRYGRFNTFTVGDQKDEERLARGALDALARQHDWEIGQRLDQSPVDFESNYFEYGGGLSMGWYDNEAPDFDAIAAESKGKSPQQPKQKKGYRPDAMHSLIGGMLMFIRGELDGEKTPHPAYSSQEALAKLLTDELKGYPGLSLRNIQDKFGAANRAISQPN